LVLIALCSPLQERSIKHHSLYLKS
jgi:hypothetical protein